MQQEALYTATAEDRLRLISEKLAAEDAITSENLDMRKSLRENSKRLARLRAEKDSLSREGVQRSIADIGKLPVVATTGKERARIMKERYHAQAKEILAGRGGLMSNTELAAMMCLDAHGLAGIIGDCPEITKEYDGREKNEKTFWRLKR